MTFLKSPTDTLKLSRILTTSDLGKEGSAIGETYSEEDRDMYDKIFVTPYLTKSVRDYFYPMDWKEINKPKQKHHVRNAYPQFQNIKVKDHLNLQLDSDIDKLFETLLDDKEINFKNRSRILDISKDWNKTGVSSLKEFL